ncbi:MATE family efflux transporter [Lutimaribacter sp. EGI FJ00015]|uniref:MATE family efflux transporter n=1 Tax=Lutimaribacter degradans TaxID=2945989 RepID=A0ACC6A1D1_9RHOB|nr:MATE family efflux transporter [Lutimaribacter sp. EGI FJ00013]MCM2563885.1 MATE family efflux transporter [Lutimaribacter sp. EGI FJ00013]MCO0614213.1 MATE family efflux transporter [Lutimaribacter sp. EGI FJ00015]MCO0636190.1 MATE family efflux transporter [Lutimaribacter sp. EGI FJ00014]
MDEAAKPLTHARVLKIAIPIMLANVTVPILGAVDTGVVGQLGQAAPIGAVGVGAVILSAVYWIFGFLRMGTTGLTAQAVGQGNRPEVAALLTRAIAIGLAGGLALILCQSLVIRGGFAVAPASAEVEALAATYMRIRVWSAPAAIAIYGITGWLIAQERTRAVLGLQLWMNGLNVVLDLWFVLGLGWGVGGVATATFIAEWSGLALGLWLCRAAFRVPDWCDWARVFDSVKLKRMAVVNTDILIRSLLLQTILVSFLLLGARFGDVTLAANQVLLQFMNITSYAMDGFAFAAEALVGHAVGRRSAQLVRRSSIMAAFWGVGTAVLMAAGFVVLGPAIIDTMTTAAPVRAAARDYLPWMAAVPLLGVLPFMLDGIFIGATRSADMRNMMAVSAAIYALAVVLLIGPLGNHGLWLALLISFAARGLTLALRYPALERAVVAGAT